MPSIETTTPDGIRLVGRLWPAWAAPRAAVALVHGLGDHSGRYDELAGALQQAGMACVALDLRGHGRSGGQRGHAAFADLRADVARIVELAQCEAAGAPVVLAGHSMGGTLVLSLGVRHRLPLAALVALSPFFARPEPPGPLVWHAAHLLARLAPRFPINSHVDDAVLTHDPEQLEQMRRDPLRHKRISARLAVELFHEGRWLQQHAQQLALPLLLMHGSADRLTSFQASEQFAQAAPDGLCTFRPWPALYHELLKEVNRQAVLAAVVEYVRRVVGE